MTEACAFNENIGVMCDCAPSGGDLNANAECNIPIFSQDWWLDAVSPGEWGVSEVKENGVLLARWPYSYEKKFGLRILKNPKLTPRLGPQLMLSVKNPHERASMQKSILGKLVEFLPKYDYLVQNCGYDFQNWLPLYWRGFTQQTNYSYILSDLSNIDSIWKGIRSNIRTDIKKAAQKKLLIESGTIADLMSVVNMTFERQGKNFPYSDSLVRRIDSSCEKRDCRKILLARDLEGRLHAGIFIVWDDRFVYYLLGGGNPDYRNSGATSLLLWEAIKFASVSGKAFDFEGSMIEPIERFFRAFGGQLTPYYTIRNTTKKADILLCALNFAKAMRGLV